MSHHVHMLSERHRADLHRHFHRLGTSDRQLRFGSSLGDAGLRAYVDAIDFTHSDVFAVFDDRIRVIGTVHLAYAENEGELGLSVLREARGGGIGNSLFERATVHLSNRFIRRVFMHCLRENQVILHLARKNGMRIVLDGSEADAWLDLPSASPGTVTAEWMASNLAQLDYRQKVGAHAAREVLELLAA